MRTQADPADAALIFAGTVTKGQVKLVRECRDRTSVRITFQPQG